MICYPDGKSFFCKAAAKATGICLPGTAMISQLFNAVLARGGADWDHSSIVTVLEQLSDVEVCPD